MKRAWLVVLVVLGGLGDGIAGELRAGAAAVDVTPHHFPVRVAGNIRENKVSEVDSPLHAKAVVLDDGEDRVVVAVVDNCLLDRALLDEVKQAASERTGIAVERMMISATHTHSAPPVVGIHGSDPEEGYRRQLYGAILMAILRAEKNLEAAEIAFGSGVCDEYVFCRRWEMKPGTATEVKFTGREEPNIAQMNPGNGNANKVRQTGVVDPEVTVWAVRAVSDGRPLAVMGNYSTHYVGAPGVSADYFGLFGERVGELLGAEDVDGRPGFVGILSNGTSGDANCIDFSAEERVPFDRKLVADVVAGVAVGALEGRAWRRELDVRMLETEVKFGVRMPSTEEVLEAVAYLAASLGEDGLVKGWDDNYARETVLLSEMAATRTLRLQALALGDELALTAIPCEVYGSTGMALKEGSGFAVTMNVGLANGYEGYLPPEEQFALGGYTTWRARSSCLEEGAEAVVTRKVLGLLTGLGEADVRKEGASFELEAGDLEISLVASEPDVVEGR